MCGQCEVRPEHQVVEGYREQVRAQGWAAVDVPASRARVGFSYTIGLTRHHGHPEVLVSGLSPREAGALLADLEQYVRAGERYTPGDVLSPDGRHRFQLVRVADPARLAHAQDVYARPGPAGPVPALQIVWSDCDGHWPWHPGWPGRLSDQPLFGLPMHH